MNSLFFSYKTKVDKAYIIRVKGNENSEEQALKCAATCNQVNMPFQLWDAYNDTTKDPQDIDIDLSTFVYVSGAITGQDFFNLKARRLNTNDGQKFYGAGLTTLEFNKFDNIGWVAYAVTGPTSSDVVHLGGAKNLNTIVSYFVESDTSTEVGTYIQQ